MACGDKYKHLLDLGDGRTADEPYEYWCNEPDAQLWYQRALQVFDLQRAAWNRLIKVENARRAWPHTERIRPLATKYEGQYQALDEPSVWMAFGADGCSDAVAAYIANVREGICVLELLEDALAKVASKGASRGIGSLVAWAAAGISAVVAGAAIATSPRRRRWRKRA